jgi:hypothetical protein
MRVKCIDYGYSDMKYGEEFEIPTPIGAYYFIKGAYRLINKFERIDKVMKIKDWKELDGIKLANGYVIEATKYEYKLALSHHKFATMELSREGIGTEDIIKILAALGLDVEFEKEPTITQEEHDLLKWLGNYEDLFLHKWRDGEEIACGTFKAQKSYGIHFTKCLFNWFKPNKQYAVSDLLKMKVEG